MEPYKTHLKQAMKYQETGHGKHEWLFYTRAEAVRVANYLRGYGYRIEFNHYPGLKRIGCEFLLVLKREIPRNR